MGGIGFGLEKIGIHAQRHPVVYSLLILIVSALAIWNVPKVRFDGNVTSVLPEESEAYRNYFAQSDAFRDFSRDITIIVQSDRLMTASGLEDLRYLQLDIALNENVENATTIFSTPDPDTATGEIRNFFPDTFSDDATAVAEVSRLVKTFPATASLIAPEQNTAVILVTLNTGLASDDGKVYGSFKDLENVSRDAAPADFKLYFSGLTPIGVTIVGALVSDQFKLSVVGMILGTLIGLYVFRSLLAAVICAIPPALTVLWSLGLVGYFGIPINYLSTVLPTLAMILAFADGIVLYFRWQVSNNENPDPDANLTDALVRVGPASALTSITTLLAFLSFSFASGSALKEFSWLGMSVVALAFLAVITGLPVAIHWAIRLGLVRPGTVRKTSFSTLGSRFFAFVKPRPVVLTSLALLIVAGLGVVHVLIRAEYRITDYLPLNSEVRTGEEIANEVIGGRSLLFVSVPVAEAGSPFLQANLDRLGEVETVVKTVFKPEQVFSILQLTNRLESRAAIDNLAKTVDEAKSTARSSYVSRDGKQLLVSARIPSGQSIQLTLEQIDALQAGLGKLSYGKDVIVTGFDVLMAREFTGLIGQLRTSLLLAIFLGVIIVGIATRAPYLAIAALTPNLLPVLAVEFAVWLKGGTINLSEVIALTIAFGIAIDNAVHVINVYTSEKRAGFAPDIALERAVKEVGPALGASTMIICVACLVTQISNLPVVPVLGRLMIATLIVALVSNLAVLPANILTINRLMARFGMRN
ncbi:MAG: MMPL family transporter [Nitratireductor sp.]